jgi:hypothetical protein
MNAAVTQDELGTHLDWEIDGVTATMIDWFWSNPRLHELYRVVENPAYNPFADLGVERRDDVVRYRSIA